MTELPPKVWEFDEVVVRANMLEARNPLLNYNRFVERELLKNGEVAIRNHSGSINLWRLPHNGKNIKRSGGAGT